jgi:ribosomal subunit interface protein
MVPVQILFQNTGPSDAVAAAIRKRAEALKRFHDRIVECRVVVEQVSRHHVQGRLYEVRVDIVVPGGEIVANRSPAEDQAHEDVYVAIRDAFDAARRRLMDHVRRTASHRATDRRLAEHKGPAPSRAPGKTHHARRHGTVARLVADEEYGFIATSDGREVYFHKGSVTNGSWARLAPGARVRFTEEAGDQGPHALSVAVLG